MLSASLAPVLQAKGMHQFFNKDAGRKAAEERKRLHEQQMAEDGWGGSSSTAAAPQVWLAAAFVCHLFCSQPCCLLPPSSCFMDVRLGSLRKRGSLSCLSCCSWDPRRVQGGQRSGEQTYDLKPYSSDGGGRYPAVHRTGGNGATVGSSRPDDISRRLEQLEMQTEYAGARR